MKIKNFVLKKGKLKININDVEFSHKGIYVIKGANGSGKTSFIETFLKENNYIDIENKQSNIVYFSQQLYKYSINGHKYLETDNKILLQKYCEIFEVDYLDKNIQEISGGEFVKLAIIRCLIKDTPILIFDEPTNSLDNSSTEKVLFVLNELSKSKTIIVSTHDKRLNLDYHTEYIIENEGIIKKTKKKIDLEDIDYIKTNQIHKNKIFGEIFYSSFNKLMFSLLLVLLISISIISANNIKFNVYIEKKLKADNFIEILDVNENYNTYVKSTVSKKELHSKYINSINHFNTEELIDLSSKSFIKNIFVIDLGYLNKIIENTNTNNINIFSIPNIITDSPNYQRTYPGCKGFLLLGRLPKDNKSEAIVSYEQMQKHWNYTGDINDIIGTNIEINNKKYNIVGITNLPIITISYDLDNQFGVIEVKEEDRLNNILKTMRTQGYDEEDLYYRNIFIEYKEGSDKELMNVLVRDASSYQYYSNFVNNKIMLYTYKNASIKMILISLLFATLACILLIITSKKSFVIIDDYIQDINNINFKPRKNVANLYKVLLLDFLIVLPILIIVSFLYMRTLIGLLMMIPFYGICILTFSCSFLILKKVSKRYA